MRLKRIILTSILAVGIAIPAAVWATPSDADQLIALGMHPALARKLVQVVNTLASPFTNNTWVTVRNAANSGNINVVKVDSSDETYVNADTGDSLHFSNAGTSQVEVDDGAIFPTTDDDVDVGKTTKEFKDGFFDGTLTTDALVNSGASTLAGAILSGTETALDADVTTATTAAPLLGVVGGSATQSQVAVVQNVASTAGGQIVGLKTRAAAGSTNANTIVANGDDILAIKAMGADGVDYQPAAQILLESGGAPGAGDMPGQIVMSTTADGAATLTTALTIGPTQLVTAANGVTVTAGNVTATNGEIVSSTSGKTVALQEATAGAACMGTATANGTTAVTVSTTCATTGSRIFISRTGDGSGSAANDQVGCWTTNIVNATSFDLDCSDANDNATFNWIIFHEAA